jgi:hypothetical protein
MILFTTIYGNSWVEEQNLLASDGGDRNDYFGRTVSISGNIALAGVKRDDDNGSDSCSAYVYIIERTEKAILKDFNIAIIQDNHH